jgi:hypothetical protein
MFPLKQFIHFVDQARIIVAACDQVRLVWRPNYAANLLRVGFDFSQQCHGASPTRFPPRFQYRPFDGKVPSGASFVSDYQILCIDKGTENSL